MSKKILIVGSKYYDDIYQNLLKGDLETIKNAKYEYEICFKTFYKVIKGRSYA